MQKYVYLKGGPMNGEVVKINLKFEGIRTEFPPNIEYEGSCYKLVIKDSQIPFYEHIQSTS